MSRNEPEKRSGFSSDTMTIRGRTIDTQLGMVRHDELKYFADNPRVYSLVHDEDGEPTQDEIERKLQKQDYVRELAKDIESHGGLIEPLIVKEGSMEVLEGNSRLAAYRMLIRKEPAKWSRIRCTILPSDINESLVSALLSQLHLKGKKEWPPYEQGGHLYRRFRKHKIPLKELSAETGLTSNRIQTIVTAYQLMMDHGDEKRANWSYYLEIVKSRKIQKARNLYADFDEILVKKIHNGEIQSAQDLRDKLPLVCENPKVLKKFVDGKLEFEHAVEEAEAGGASDVSYVRLNKFRTWLAEPSVQDALVESNGAVRPKIEFEIKRLLKMLSRLQQRLE